MILEKKTDEMDVTQKYTSMEVYGATYTGLLKMIVGVLTTCHKKYT